MGSVVSIASGNHRARVLARRDALVESHLALVGAIARAISYTLPAGFDYDDLRSAGCIGLLKAATNYDPVRHAGVPFSSYARPVIRGAIMDSVRRANYIENTRPGFDDSTPEPSSTPDYEEHLDSERRRERVVVAIDRLEPRLRRLVQLHYIDGKRIRDAAGAIGKSRATQLHRAALGQLRVELSA